MTKVAQNDKKTCQERAGPVWEESKGQKRTIREDHKAKETLRTRQDSNLRGQSPIDF
jgi:hypothetical protein